MNVMLIISCLFACLSAQLFCFVFFEIDSYVSKDLKSLLKEQGVSLNTPVKKEKGKKVSMVDEIVSSAVSKIRQPIESLFSWIDEKTGIQTASKARSTQGLLVHVYGKLSAAMLLLTPIFNS